MRIKALKRYMGWPAGVPVNVKEGDEIDIQDTAANYLLETYPTWFKSMGESPSNKMVKMSMNK